MWTTDGDQPCLVGTRCSACGATYFPTSPYCRGCGSDDVAERSLAATGVVQTWTRVGEVAVADVRLDDGVLVFGRVEPAGKIEVAARVRFAPAEEIVRFELDA